jgi:hypothetical protein
MFSPKPIPPDTARAFVQGLFLHLLQRSTMTDDETSYWTEFLVSRQDPVDVFHRFVASREYEELRGRERTAKTAYPSGHFYSPVVRVSDVVENENLVFSPKELLGIDLAMESQRQLFETLSSFFPSMPFTDKPGDGHRYGYDNSSYGFGDACIYWAIIGLFRPRRILEVGSGFSSALALDAIESFNCSTSCTFVDPYPELLNDVVGCVEPHHKVVDQPIQRVGIELIAALESDDILFVDSSHVAKTGSDVVYEITEMLPRLSSGVIVHFHDVFVNFEYPKAWVLDDNKSWNELYMLHSFLMFNHEFQVIFSNDAFARQNPELVARCAGSSASRFMLNPGGGLWLRRR